MSPKAHFASPNLVTIYALYKQYLFQSDVSRPEVLKHIMWRSPLVTFPRTPLVRILIVDLLMIIEQV